MRVTTTLIVLLTAATTTADEYKTTDAPDGTLGSYDDINCTTVGNDPYGKPKDFTTLKYNTCTRFIPATNNIWVGRSNLFDNMTFYTDENCFNVGTAGTRTIPGDPKKERFPKRFQADIQNASCMHPSDFGEKWGSFKVGMFVMPKKPDGSRYPNMGSTLRDDY